MLLKMTPRRRDGSPHMIAGMEGVGESSDLA